MYDELVSGLFKDRLHLADEDRIVFARRGKSERTVALEAAIREAKRKFEVRWQKGVDRPTTIRSSTPSKEIIQRPVNFGTEATPGLVDPAEFVAFEDHWTGSYIFENEWQSFRTRKDRALEMTSARHEYEKPGRYVIAVKVIDIFGNDTMSLTPITVG